MKVVVDDLMTEYLRAGKVGAPVILMLPGWKAPVADFAALMKGSNFDVVALNFPGFGVSETPPRTWTVQDYTSFVAKFIAKLSLAKIHAIIGHSFGGRIMLNGCASGQLDADKLIFIDSAGVKPRASTRGQMLKSLSKISRVLPEKQLGKLRQKFGSADYNDTSGVMRETFKQIVNLDLTPKMPQIKQPSLLIWGADDQDTPLADARIFAEKIPRAKLEIIESAGHYAYMDQPEKVAQLVKDFLK